MMGEVMDTDFGKIFDGEAPAEPEAEIVENVEAELPVEEAAEPEAEVAPEPAAEPQPRDEQGRYVPLDALKEEREKRQTLEKTVTEMQARLQQMQQPAPQPQAIPDAIDDPNGFNNYVQSQIQHAQIVSRLETSRLVAMQQHGADKFQEAAEWARQKSAEDPTFEQRMISQPHPADWVVRQHQRETMLSQIGEDPDDFVRRRAAELGLTAPVAAPVAAVPQQASQPVRVPRSLASQSGESPGVRHVPTGPLAGVDAVFK